MKAVSYTHLAKNIEEFHLTKLARTEKQNKDYQNICLLYTSNRRTSAKAVNLVSSV